LISAWALQQCSATALPVIIRIITICAYLKLTFSAKSCSASFTWVPQCWRYYEPSWWLSFPVISSHYSKVRSRVKWKHILFRHFIAISVKKLLFYNIV